MISSTAEVLVFTLSRFSFDQEAGAATKIEKLVRYPKELSLPGQVRLLLSFSSNSFFVLTSLFPTHRLASCTISSPSSPTSELESRMVITSLNFEPRTGQAGLERMIRASPVSLLLWIGLMPISWCILGESSLQASV